MRLPVLVVVMLLAGCASRPEPTPLATGPTLVPGLQAVEDGVLVDRAELPGLLIDAEAGTYTWEPLEFIERDTMRLLLLQATANTTYDLSFDQRVEFVDRDAIGISQETVCAGNLLGPDQVPGVMAFPGEYYLDLALGHPVTPPARLPPVGFGHAALYGPQLPQALGAGSASGGGSVNGTLAAGEWLLFGSGLSGVDASGTGTESYDRSIVRSDAPLRIVELPPAPFVCGMGFSALQDETLHTGPPGVQIGGALEVPMPYGTAFSWVDICWPADGPSPTNLAYATVGDERITLTQATLNRTAGSFLRTPARMEVDQWKGYPLWSFLGLGVDLPDYEPAELTGCLR